MQNQLDIIELFRAVVKRLQKENVTFAIAGGIVVSLYTNQKRGTDDLDFLLFSQENSEKLAKEIIESFNLKPTLLRKADLEGGPQTAIKRKSTPAYMMIGRDPDDPENSNVIGLDFILPSMPWFDSAIERAQNHKEDFGFGKISTLTVEDMILSKFLSFRNKPTRYKDLQDIQAIFEKEQPIDYSYITGQMQKLDLAHPNVKTLEPILHNSIIKTSKKINRSQNKKRKQEQKKYNFD